VRHDSQVILRMTAVIARPISGSAIGIPDSHGSSVRDDPSDT